jgi:hypothetical protein
MWRKLAVALATSTILVASSVAAAQGVTVPKPVDATLVGHLGYEGGAYPGGFHPTAGVVDVSFHFLPLVLVSTVGRSGKFSIRLAPGTYTVSGCETPVSGSSAHPALTTGPCSTPITLTLKAGQVKHLRLIWAYVP